MFNHISQFGSRIDAVAYVKKDEDGISHEIWYPRIELENEMCKLRNEMIPNEYVHFATKELALQQAAFLRDQWIAIEQAERNLKVEYSIYIDGKYQTSIQTEDALQYVKDHYKKYIVEFGNDNHAIYLRTSLLDQIENESRTKRKMEMRQHSDTINPSTEHEYR